MTVWIVPMTRMHSVSPASCPRAWLIHEVKSAVAYSELVAAGFWSSCWVRVRYEVRMARS